jgi:hypothetical protein
MLFQVVWSGLVFLLSVLQLLLTVNVLLGKPILVTLMMEVIRSSEMSFHTRPTQRNIPEDGILHCHVLEKCILRNNNLRIVNKRL